MTGIPSREEVWDHLDDDAWWDRLIGSARPVTLDGVRAILGGFDQSIANEIAERRPVGPKRGRVWHEFVAWRAEALADKEAVTVRLQQVRAARDGRRTVTAGMLVSAIRQHRRRMLIQGGRPLPADVELWDLIGKDERS